MTGNFLGGTKIYKKAVAAVCRTMVVSVVRSRHPTTILAVRLSFRPGVPGGQSDFLCFILRALIYSHARVLHGAIVTGYLMAVLYYCACLPFPCSCAER